MQTMRESWTDERLDDLNDKVDRRFDRVDERFEQVDKRFEQVDKRFEQVDRRFEQVEVEFKAVRGEMKEGFDAVNGRIDSLQQTLSQGVIGICLAILAGFAAVTALIATQL
jgi:chromosome segregation ATPase